jgi:hypothetical protein
VIEAMRLEDFCYCENPRELVFQARSCLRTIEGIQMCPLLEGVSISNSAITIDPDAFNARPLLRVILFSRNRRMRDIRGFRNCPSLECLELPPLVQVFSSRGRLFAICGKDDFMLIARRRYHVLSG